METYTWTLTQVQAAIGLVTVVTVAGLIGAFWHGWERGYERGWKDGGEWSVKALVEVGATMRPEDEEN